MTDAGQHQASRDLLGAYALGAVDQAERELVEAHLEHCAACRHELAQLVDAAGTLPPPPRLPDELWQRIVAEVQAIEDQQRQQGHG